MKAFIETRNVGRFGTIGVIMSCGKRPRVIAETRDIRPYGFTQAARQDALRLATERGITVIEAEEF